MIVCWNLYWHLRTFTQKRQLYVYQLNFNAVFKQCTVLCNSEYCDDNGGRGINCFIIGSCEPWWTGNQPWYESPPPPCIQINISHPKNIQLEKRKSFGRIFSPRCFDNKQETQGVVVLGREGIVLKRSTLSLLSSY